MNNAFASEVLPRRTLSLIFAVIAHTLECQLCETGAADLLDVEGFSRGELGEVLDTLASPRSTTTEALLIPWARDTVWMPEQPARIQERIAPVAGGAGAGRARRGRWAARRWPTPACGSPMLQV